MQAVFAQDLTHPRTHLDGKKGTVMLAKGRDRRTMERAIVTWGGSKQVEKCVEEMAELTVALCQYHQGRSTYAETVEEIADVLIMANQMAVLFGMEDVRKEIDRKLERVEGKLNNYDYNEKPDPVFGKGAQRDDPDDQDTGEERSIHRQPVSAE